MKRFVTLIIVCLLQLNALAQALHSITGVVQYEGKPLKGVNLLLTPGDIRTQSNEDGSFTFSGLANSAYLLLIENGDFASFQQSVVVDGQDQVINIKLRKSTTALKEVVVKDKNGSASDKLRDVVGTAIYAGKKTEVINMRYINANLASNNTRQIYARIPGLNIWEYDRGGLQLGIGGRGLSPSRSSNFNIRQNGYDISADALGYPESYYTPSAEALDRIEIVRGAAGLQYGPQFGGMVNFIMKEGPSDKEIEVVTRQTAGSYGFFNSFNSIGGTLAKQKLNYYAFYQYKTGDSWRPNSHYNQHNAYIHVAYDVTKKLTLTAEYTFMQYLAQQPGGLTDAQFDEDPSISVRSRNWFKVNWNLVSLIADYKFSDRTWLNWRSYNLKGSREALGMLSYINRPDNGGNRDYQSDNYDNYSSELRLIHQYDLLNMKLNSFLVGARVYSGHTVRKQGDGDDQSGPNFDFIGDEPNKSSYTFPGTNVAFFAENIFRINRHWSITPGARYEYINTQGSGYYYKQNIFIANEKIDEDLSNPRSFFLLGIGTAWKQDNGIEWYANISQNYRSINFNDLRVQNVNAKVNPNLKDETGFNADLGFRGHYKNWLYADVSVFYLKYNDRIGSIFTRDSNFMTYRLRTNVADSRNIGLETMLEGDILRAFRVSSRFKLSAYTSFSLIDARYVNTKNTAIANKLVENVPPVLLRTGLSFGDKNFNLTYQFSYQSKQYSDATNTETTPTAVDGAVPAFSVMDLSLSYNWKHFTIYTGVNNLTDAKYFTRRADGYPGPGILPADKRNFYVTLQAKF